MAGDSPGAAPLRVRAAFPPATTEEWEAAIRRDLKNADPATLDWKPEPGLVVRPYYRREDLESLGLQASGEPGEYPFLRGGGPGWEIAQEWTVASGAIRADLLHDAGATAVQELGFGLSEAVDRLVSLIDGGEAAADAAARVEFVFAVGSAYFLEIAKLRAARLLWAQAVSAFSVPEEQRLMRMHVRTARANKSAFDRYTNLLRATTEALSAVIGGCGRLTVEAYGCDPHLAENVQRIVKEEAHLDAVADPAGGSYYIEALTDAVAREAWSLFQRIEAQGGFGVASRAGTIEAALEESRAAAGRAVALRRRTLVGVNHYVDTADEEPWPAPRQAGEAPAWRLAEPFERLRLRTAAHARTTGRTPVVLLLAHGDPKMRAARAAFSRGFFACAGFSIAESSDLKGQAADLVVLCSSDPEYLALAQAICPTSSAPVIVAGNPRDQIEALRAAGVQGFVHLGSDAVQTLTDWQERLGIGES